MGPERSTSTIEMTTVPAGYELVIDTVSAHAAMPSGQRASSLSFTAGTASKGFGIYHRQHGGLERHGHPHHRQAQQQAIGELPAPALFGPLLRPPAQRR